MVTAAPKVFFGAVIGEERMRSGSGQLSLAGRKLRAANAPEGERTLLGLAVFTPEIIQVMGEAFDRAWSAMLAAEVACATGHLAAETRRQLALAIVESARRGTRDRVRLSKDALRSFLPLGLEGEVGGRQSEDEVGVLVMDRRLPQGPGIRVREMGIRGRAQRRWERGGRSGRPEDYRLQAELASELGPPAPEATSLGRTSPRSRD